MMPMKKTKKKKKKKEHDGYQCRIEEHARLESGE